MAGWNVFFTFLPIIAIGVLDQDVEVQVALDYPRLYYRGQAGMELNLAVILKWSLHALGVVFTGLACMNDHTISAVTGWGDGHQLVGTTLFGCLMLVVNYKVFMETSNWTKWHGLCWMLTIISWFLYVLFWFPPRVLS